MKRSLRWRLTAWTVRLFARLGLIKGRKWEKQRREDS